MTFSMEEHGYPQPQPAPKKPRTIPHGIKLLFVCCLVGMIAAMLIVGMYLDEHGTADKPPLAAVAVTRISTNTAEPPTATPVPPTPYPTLTHEVGDITNTPADIVSHDNTIIDIQYVEVTRVVEVTRLVIWTETAQPATRTPVPSWTPEPTINLTHEYGLVNLERERQVNRLTGLGVFLVYFVVLISPIVGIIVARNKVLSNRPTMDDTTQTAEEIVNPYKHPKYEDIRPRVWFLRKKREASVNAIEKDLWPDTLSTGGAHYRLIIEILKQYDPLGEYGPATPPPVPLGGIKPAI